MSYFAPFVDESGLHLPTFNDLDEYVKDAYKSIYGQATSLDNANEDIQLFSVFSLMLNDVYSAAALANNGRSPATAVGADLDSVNKCNGIFRKEATASTVPATINGTPGKEIINGAAQDQNGILWLLPTSVIISVTGSTSITLTCSQVGAITADINSITVIATPTKGWTSVTNTDRASVGRAIEPDSQYRARQAISVGISSKTMTAGTIAQIAQLAGVTRWNPGTKTAGGPGTSVENPTGTTDSWGNPKNSISMVVEGGTDADVALTILLNKTPGCLTNGTTVVSVADPTTKVPMDIGFFRPTYIAPWVTVHLKMLNGYTTATTAAIQNVIADYMNDLQIGEALSTSTLNAVAFTQTPNIKQPTFSVTSLTIGLTQGSQSTNDISPNFNQVIQGVLSQVLVVVS